MPPRGDDATLARIEGKLDRVEARLAAIEQQQPLALYLRERADERFDKLETKITELATHQTAATTSTIDRRWLTGVTVTVAGLAVGVGTLAVALVRLATGA